MLCFFEDEKNQQDIFFIKINIMAVGKCGWRKRAFNLSKNGQTKHTYFFSTKKNVCSRFAHLNGHAIASWRQLTEAWMNKKRPQHTWIMLVPCDTLSQIQWTELSIICENRTVKIWPFFVTAAPGAVTAIVAVALHRCCCLIFHRSIIWCQKMHFALSPCLSFLRPMLPTNIYNKSAIVYVHKHVLRRDSQTRRHGEWDRQRLGDKRMNTMPAYGKPQLFSYQPRHSPLP